MNFFHLIIGVVINESVLVPKPINIRNELDGVAIPFGIERYPGERSNDFRDHLLRAGKFGFGDPQKYLEVAAVESRSNFDYVLGESLSDTSIIKIGVLSHNMLSVDRYVEQTSAPFYTKTSYSYDLMDRSSFPFLENVCAKVSVDCTEVRMKIAEAINGFRYDLPPYAMFPNQLNYGYRSESLKSGTSQLLAYNRIIPDSIDSSFYLKDESITFNRVGAVDQVTSPGDFYVDCTQGRIYCGTNFHLYNFSLSYQYSLPKSSFYCSPTSFFFLNDNDTLWRMNGLEGAHSYAIDNNIYYNSGTATSVGTCQSLYFAPHLSDVILENDKRTKWG